jgi:hypothetical protein
MYLAKALLVASCLGIAGSVRAAPAPTKTSTCPMPVARTDMAGVAPMPVDRTNTAMPMPTQRPGCTNPLFVGP